MHRHQHRGARAGRRAGPAGLLVPVAAAVLALMAAACSDRRAPRATPGYDPETGRLVTLVTDANGNGVDDTTSHMDGTRILRIELDLDENGRIERWDFYGADGELERIGLARENDGVMDAMAYYGVEGELERMEISTRRDGVFDRVELYENGRLARSADDTDGDGRADKWDEYTVTPGTAGRPEYAVAATAFDESGSGRPERRFVFGPDGAVARVEIDPDGDGVFVQASAR